MSSTSSPGARPRRGLPSNPRQWLLEKQQQQQQQQKQHTRNPSAASTGGPLRVDTSSNGSSAAAPRTSEAASSRSDVPPNNHKPIILAQSLTTSPVEEKDFSDLLDCYSSSEQEGSSTNISFPSGINKEVQHHQHSAASSGEAAAAEIQNPLPRTSSKWTSISNGQERHRASNSSKGSSASASASSYSEPGFKMRILTANADGKSFTRKRSHYPLRPSLELFQLHAHLAKPASLPPGSLTHDRAASVDSPWVGHHSAPKPNKDKHSQTTGPRLGSDSIAWNPRPGSETSLESGDPRGPDGWKRDSREDGATWDADELLEAYQEATWEDSEGSSRDSCSTSVVTSSDVRLNLCLRPPPTPPSDTADLARLYSHLSLLLPPPPLSAKSESSHYSIESETRPS